MVNLKVYCVLNFCDRAPDKRVLDFGEHLPRVDEDIIIGDSIETAAFFGSVKSIMWICTDGKYYPQLTINAREILSKHGD